MRSAGRAEACNANWGTSAAYMVAASGAFWDLWTQGPGRVGIKTSHGASDEEKEQYSRTMSSTADGIIARNKVFNFDMLRSQWEMTLHGTGPLVFENEFGSFPRSVQSGDLKVPEFTLADVEYFDDGCAVIINYNPTRLYSFIANPDAA